MSFRSTPRRGRRTLRLAAALTVSALSMSLLAACGGGDSSNDSADSGPVTITFWGWAKGTEDVVKAFNTSHKDVQVTFEQIPSGNAAWAMRKSPTRSRQATPRTCSTSSTAPCRTSSARAPSRTSPRSSRTRSRRSTCPSRSS